jgi:hypothetical protein
MSSYGRPMPRLDRGPGNRPAKTLGLDIPDRLLALTGGDRVNRRTFITLLGGAAAVVCSRTRAAALPTDRPICNARVPQAIGQSFDWLDT